MPATVLPFIRRDPSSPRDGSVLTRFRPRALPPSRDMASKEIAHRWAMLSHLTRRRHKEPCDPVR